MQAPPVDPNPEHAWHALTVADALLAVGSDAQRGLSAADARARLQAHGPNELVEDVRRGPLRILWDQLRSTMVLILIAAAALSGLLGKATEALAIAAIVLLFTLLGFVQEHRAERAMAALKRVANPLVRVRRDGQVSEMHARNLVPGDLVLLDAGSVVPADLRLLDNAALQVQEAALTGESEPVDKRSDALSEPDVPLGDRRNLLFMGTSVTLGRAEAVVVRTGMSTELGHIARLIQGVETELTPLQRQLDRVGKALAAIGVAVAALIVVIGLAQGQALADMLLTAVSVAVAVVPEGLPALVTATLALGAQRMLRRKALIRKLPAVETLGSVTTICSDKTGTLTQNRMTLAAIDVAGHTVDLLRSNPAPQVCAGGPGEPRAADLPPGGALLLAASALCNDASFSQEPDAKPAALGDPTEGALLIAAARAGLHQDDLRRTLPRVGELPFDPVRKRMTTLHRLPDTAADGRGPAVAGFHDGDHAYVAITKGAVDGLLDTCDREWTAGGAQPLDSAGRARVRRAHDALAARGMRVLGVALRWLDDPANLAERELLFLGLAALIDPPRPEARAAVRTCMDAGIRPIMITGDHPLTARSIASDLGICQDKPVVTGMQLARMSAEQLAAAVADHSVFARVSPEHKLRIVEILQKRGEVVAMTGDGVNDSPALRKADIGIAMGVSGTDVSKEAAAMVLLDDNFATIVAAVEEGRVIFANIRRFAKFSVAGNIAKVLVMLLAPAAGIPIALLPLQLLWLNLLTDGLLGLGLGLEPPGPGVMRRPPRPRAAPFFPRAMLVQLLWVGTLIGGLALAVGLYYRQPGDPPGGRWQTMIFTSLSFLQVGQALAARSSTASTFALGAFTNKPLAGLAALTVALQLTVLYVPFFHRFFQITPLTPADLLICVGFGVFLFAAIEVSKWSVRRRR